MRDSWTASAGALPWHPDFKTNRSLGINGFLGQGFEDWISGRAMKSVRPELKTLKSVFTQYWVNVGRNLLNLVLVPRHSPTGSCGLSAMTLV